MLFCLKLASILQLSYVRLNSVEYKLDQIVDVRLVARISFFLYAVGDDHAYRGRLVPEQACQSC